MLYQVCGILIVFHSGLVNSVEYYPADLGYDTGIGYGEKFTNVEYGPGSYGYTNGISNHYGYKTPLAQISPGVAYGEGIVGIPKATGLGYGYEQGYGTLGPKIGYKQDFKYSPLGADYGYKSSLQYGPVAFNDVGYKPVYEPVGITKGVAPFYGAVSPVSYSHHGIVYPHYDGLGYGHGKLIGGSEVDQSVYGGGNRNIVGDHYTKSHGVNGEELNHGDAGYNTGKVAVKDYKGDSVHLVDANGGNLAHHAGKTYQGGQHFDKEGKHGGEQVVKDGFKKGHNIKSFKKSHHLDETGKTEEFYDENHDEGGNYHFDGNSGLFGENGASSFKGGQEDGKYASGGAKKEGHYDNEYIVDKEHAGHGKFGGNKYAQNGEVYGTHKGLGEHDLSGHHESSNYYKHYPFHY